MKDSNFLYMGVLNSAKQWLVYRYFDWHILCTTTVICEINLVQEYNLTRNDKK